MPWFTSFQGRIRRLQYWTGILLLIIPNALLMLVASVTGLYSHTKVMEALLAGDLDGLLIAQIPLMVILSPVYWMSFSLNVKRLHDRNRSGYWMLALTIGPNALFYLGIALGLNSGFGFALVALRSLIGGAGGIYIAFFPSDPNYNRYGPGPSAIDAEGVDNTFGKADTEKVVFG